MHDQDSTIAPNKCTELETEVLGAETVELQGAAVRAGGWILTLAVVGLWICTGQLWRRGTPKQSIVAADYAVDINHATERDLLNLPEVGPSLARSILAYRVQHGDFQSLADVGEVPGVGPQTLKQLAPFLYFANRTNGMASELSQSTTEEEPILTAQRRERMTP